MWGREFTAEQITQVPLYGQPARRSSEVLLTRSKFTPVLAAVLAPPGGNFPPWLERWWGPFWAVWPFWLFQDSGSDSKNLPINWSKFCGSIWGNSSGRNLGTWGFILHFLTWGGRVVLSSIESVLQRRPWQTWGGSYETRCRWIFQAQEGRSGQEFSILYLCKRQIWKKF